MASATFERHIALPFLARLRWIAVVGQIAATMLGMLWLHLRLPLPWIALVISVTAISNLIVQIWDRLGPPADWFAPAIIVLDVCLFTVLLYLTGGTDNPFIMLYAVHIAMAVVVLGGFWAWLVVGISGVSSLLVYFWHIPLEPNDRLNERVWQFGVWIAIVLVMGLIAYFVGRVTGTLRDRERELALAQERARRHEHLASLTTLAAGAAHELGTPLSTIALVAKEMEIASERGGDGTSLTEDAQLIRKEVDRCRGILDRMRVDVLDDAANRPSATPLAELLEQLRTDLRQQEQSRLKVITSESSDSTITRSRMLRRAVGVLLRNAFDASPAEGEVSLHFQRSAGRIMFEVRDSGAGMSDEVLRRAGEPFFTTKAPGEGMGLGLFLVRLVAETYQGRFELQSRPGGGTRSILELPESAGGKDEG
jgi:two-component system sensor histidine kinase RegB